MTFNIIIEINSQDDSEAAKIAHVIRKLASRLDADRRVLKAYRLTDIDGKCVGDAEVVTEENKQ